MIYRRNSIRKNPRIVWQKNANGGYTGTTSGDFTYFLNKNTGGDWHAYVRIPKLGAHMPALPIEFEDDLRSLYEVKDACEDFDRLSEKSKLKKIAGAGSHDSELAKADTRTLYNLYRKLSNYE